MLPSSACSAIPLAEWTVLCRQGVRAVISQNQEVPAELQEEGDRYQETYLHYADRGPEKAGFSQYPGDARAALAPFLAARHVGVDNFKWVLFGDGAPTNTCSLLTLHANILEATCC